MLLKVLLVLKTGNFSDWIGSRVACNAPVSRVGEGGAGRVVRGFQMTGA